LKKLQVFVSSTYLDLKEERQKAVEGILRAGHIPAGMELFTAGSKGQWDVIEGWIKESDVLMLILGGRYGSLDLEKQKSYTELEYQFALEHKIPVFSIILNDQYLANKKSKNIDIKIYEHEIENPEMEKHKAFKELVKSNLVKFIEDINEISTEVVLSLQDFMKKDEDEYHFKGWIRGDEVEKIGSKNVQNNSKLFEMDEKLLEEIINILEEDSFIDKIEYIECYCMYLRHYKNKLDKFLYFTQKPTTRFFNKEVQKFFGQLIKSLDEYTSYLSLNFFPRGDTEKYYLYPDLNIDFNYVDEKGRKLYDQHAEEFFTVSRKTIKEIRDFIHSSRLALYE